MLESITYPLFYPLLKIPVVLSLFIVSCLMSLLITIIYRWMTDQKQMKRLKDDMKDLQKQMKENKGNAEKLMSLQKKAMESNLKYMTSSMKPTLVTFIPVIIVFSGLAAFLAYDPITPDQPFSVTATFAKEAIGNATLYIPATFTYVTDKTQKIAERKASWTIKGPKGDYFLQVEYNGDRKPKAVLITNEKRYASVEDRFSGSQITMIKINNNDVRPFGMLSIFGYKPGWLMTYILFSLLSSLAFRKLFKVY